jgi:methylated-DNA-[protein]-cysteine S-methyltransferase
MTRKRPHAQFGLWEKAMDQCLFVTYASSLGPLLLGATAQGVCWLGFPGDGQLGGLRAFLARRGMRGSAGEHPYLEQAAAEIRDYLAGERCLFTVPLDLRGTGFQLAVWQALRDIPYGQTTSYARLAASIGRPRASRAVGQATHRNPVPILVPCHRLIGADGSLTGFGGGLELKRRLLNLEGVVV